MQLHRVRIHASVPFFEGARNRLLGTWNSNLLHNLPVTKGGFPGANL